MDNKKRLVDICRKQMMEKGFTEEKHKKRFKEEYWEINARGEYDYFLDLYDKKVKYPFNEHNLLIVELLDIDVSHSFDIDSPPATEMGDFPDIDIDYLAPIRDYLKNDWAPRHFGPERVCNISSYNTFGIKSALIDMAKVHGLDRKEIMAITKNIRPKDDDGKPLTWETALEIYKPLKKYCDDHPDVADATKRLVDRNRGKGKHAGGLIIANQRLDELVPLVTDNDGNVTSAWTEGLHAQDLGPMGLIKFDLLVITNIEQVAKVAELIAERASKLINERHGMICALEGKANWTDTSYLEDPKALALANRGLLKGIFQFDSDGIRALVRKGGVKRFDDLVAYTALYRPGPLECLHKDSEIKTINGQKTIKELKTFCDKIAYINSQGKVSHTDRFFLIKGKKKKMVKVRTKSGKTIMCSLDHKFLTKGKQFIEIKNLKKGDEVVTVDMTDDEIISIEEIGTEDCYDISLLEEDVYMDEPNYVANNFIVHNSGMHNTYCNRASGRERYSLHPILEKILSKTHGTIVYQEQCMQIANAVGKIPLKDGYALIKAISKKKVEVFHKYREMFIENGQHTLGWTEEAVTELWEQIEAFASYAFNLSHSVAYTYVSSRLLYEKAHYPLEFFTGLLQCETNEDKIKDYRNDASSNFDVITKPVDVNKSNAIATIVEDDEGPRIYAGISTIKGVGMTPAMKIQAERENNGCFTSLQNFMDRCGTDSNVLKSFIALRVFKDADPITLYKFYEYYKAELTKRENRKKRYEKNKASNEAELDLLLKSSSEDDKEVLKLRKKIAKSKLVFENKLKKDLENPISLETFDADGFDFYIEDKIMNYLTDIDAAEKDFYGFVWVPMVSLSPDYKGNMTFEKLRNDAEHVGGQITAPIEVKVWDFKKVNFKNGKGFRYVAELEDANQEKNSVTIWSNDYVNWTEEIQPGNLLRIRITSPQEGYGGYTFESFGRNVKVDKDRDYRIVLMEPGIKREDWQIKSDEQVIDEIKDSYENI